MAEERDPDEARPLHVTLLVYETATSHPETVDVDVAVSDNATVAELKVILETSDLIPPSDEEVSSAVEPMQVCVRLNADSAVLNDDDYIAKEQTQVQVLVLPKDAPVPQPRPRVASRRLPPVVTPAHVEDMAFLPPPPAAGGMQALLSTPLVRSLLSNPDVLRSLLDSNPQMRELRERNPELNSLFNDPDLFRQSVEAMQNPSLLREMVSNTDRALSNIDAIPGGFNALRRVYNDIQSPLWDATAGMGAQHTERRHYSIDNSAAPNCAPVPNPFAPNRRTAPVEPPAPPINRCISRRRKVKVPVAPSESRAAKCSVPSIPEEAATINSVRPTAATPPSPLSVPSPSDVAPSEAATAPQQRVSASAGIRRALYGNLLPGVSLFQRPPTQPDEPGGGTTSDGGTPRQRQNPEEEPQG